MPGSPQVDWQNVINTATVVVAIVIVLVVLRQFKLLPDGTSIKWTEVWRAIVYIVLILFGVGFVLWLLGGSLALLGIQSTNPTGSADNEVSSALLRGVLALLVVLGGLTVLFSRINLPSPNEALGLPPGSVRALIALLLVLIFAIYAVRLLTFSKGESHIVAGVTQEQLNQLLAQSASLVESSSKNTDGSYDVALRDPPLSDTASNVGGQILTTISTLATAVAAFYFGTQSVAAATKGAAADAAPQVVSVTPNHWSSADGPLAKFTVIGSNFDAPKLRLENGTNVLTPLVTVGNDGTSLNCELALTENMPKLVYDVIVTNKAGTGLPGTLPNGFEIR